MVVWQPLSLTVLGRTTKQPITVIGETLLRRIKSKPRNFWCPDDHKFFAKYLSSLNTRQISQIDFWGRNAVAPKVTE